MEIGARIQENLSLAGDTAHIPDKCFDHLVKKACQGILSDVDRNAVADDPAFKSVDKGVLKAAYSGLVALVLEAAKHDMDANGIMPFLEECKFSPDRIQSFNNLFLAQKSAIQILLGSIGSSRPHIVDVDWRLDYYIKSNHMERINESVYLISLKTEVPGQEELQEVQFTCSLEQLQPAMNVTVGLGNAVVFERRNTQKHTVFFFLSSTEKTKIKMSRQVLQVFEQYQKSRTQFVQTVAELATRPQNIETLQNAGVMSLLRPLLLDIVPTIQQTAALALGRLANYNDDLAEAVVRGDILPQLVYSLAEQNRFYKKAAAFVLRAVAKHSPQLAQSVVDCGALDALVICLEEFDPGVKEAAAWALGYIARHNAELAQAVVDAGAVPLLVLCIQEPELSLKRIAASALSDICKHSPELAQTVVDAGAIAHLAQMILNPDAKLKRQVFSALSQIAKHSVDLAEMVVEAEIFPAVLTCLKDPDEYVKKNVATLIREIAKHTPELAQLIVNAGGVAAVVDYVGECKGNVRLPGIMMLGYVAAHSENLAMAVIVSKGVVQLAIALSEESEDHIQSAAAWALGQIGRHTPEHAKAVAVANVLPRLLQCYLRADASEDLQIKSKKALKNILQKCVHLPALEPLLHDAPANILKHVVGQFSKVLPHDPKARRLFVTSGGLKKIQDIKADPGTALAEYINTINNCYPEEIVKYYSPGYSETLLERVEQFAPKA